MKSCLIFLFSFVAGFAAAQQTQPVSRYTISSLRTLGGTFYAGQSINNRGWIAGDANLAGDQTEHAVIWRNGVITDLGTLGGMNSLAGVINEKGVVSGWANTSAVDPLGENWSNFSCNPNGATCEGAQNLILGFVWRNGVMKALPTLGGNNALAGPFPRGMNNRGQIVGLAETATQDPNCIPPQVLDFEGVIWGAEGEILKVLAPLPGDTVSAAVAINDRGEAVGGSALCQLPNDANSAHAVLWVNGSATDLGSLGGTISNFAFDINNRHQVVGFSNLTGDTTTHAFLWQNGVMTDLGTLPGDVASFAFSVNDLGQVVGQSIDASGNLHAFLWHNGVMTDLNSLTPPDSPLYIFQPDSINSKGEIVGIAFDQSTGEFPAFLARPVCGSAFTSQEHEGKPVIIPETGRQHLRRRF